MDIRLSAVRLFAIFGVILMLAVSCSVLFESMISESSAEDQDVIYVYADLSCANLEISGNTYSLAYYEKTTADDGSVSYPKIEVSNHSFSSKTSFYVYQSKMENDVPNGYRDANSKEYVIPEYLRVIQSDGKIRYSDVSIIGSSGTDHHSKVDVAWAAAAAAAEVGRTSTVNCISISGAGQPIDVVVDSIWSTHHTPSSSRRDGGITVDTSGTNRSVDIILKGDSRIGNLYYSSQGDGNGKIPRNTDKSINSTNYNSLTIRAFNNNDDSGSITVGSFGETICNKFNSVIGSSDERSDIENVMNMKIESGMIYAGNNEKEPCTGIGAGGNGFAVIEIKGGIITAMAHTSGTAIGGGGGISSYSGQADISITGGTIYAYNYGSFDGTTFRVGTSIGSGSSVQEKGADATISIKGGSITAVSYGSTAIGAGGTATADKSSGSADITISGGTVVANAEKDLYNKGSVGVAIGTTPTTGSFGEAIINISGGSVTAKADGKSGIGGSSNQSGEARATITITGGNVDATTTVAPTGAGGVSIEKRVLHLGQGSGQVDVSYVYNEKPETLKVSYSNGYAYVWIPVGSTNLMVDGKGTSGVKFYLGDYDGVAHDAVTITGYGECTIVVSKKDGDTYNILESIPKITDPGSMILKVEITESGTKYVFEDTAQVNKRRVTVEFTRVITDSSIESYVLGPSDLKNLPSGFSVNGSYKIEDGNLSTKINNSKPTIKLGESNVSDYFFIDVGTCIINKKSSVTITFEYDGCSVIHGDASEKTWNNGDSLLIDVVLSKDSFEFAGWNVQSGNVTIRMPSGFYIDVKTIVMESGQTTITLNPVWITPDYTSTLVIGGS